MYIMQFLMYGNLWPILHKKIMDLRRRCSQGLASEIGLKNIDSAGCASGPVKIGKARCGYVQLSFVAVAGGSVHSKW